MARSYLLLNQACYQIRENQQNNQQRNQMFHWIVKHTKPERTVADTMNICQKSKIRTNLKGNRKEKQKWNSKQANKQEKQTYHEQKANKYKKITA